MSNATAIVITSGKGGTGKTSTVGGVGACLAAMGHRVLCLDTDCGLRNLDLTLGMSDLALMDFTDVIQGRCDLSRAAVEHPTLENLFLLTAPVRLPDGIGPEEMRDLVSEIKTQFDFCLIDCPAGVGDGFTLATCAADEAIVVSSSDFAALRDAQAAVDRLRARGDGEEFPVRLVMNRVKPPMLKKLRMNIDDAMDQTGLPLLGVVPEDELVPLSAARGVSIIAVARRGAAQAYYNIAKRLTGQRAPLMRL